MLPLILQDTFKYKLKSGACMQSEGVLVANRRSLLEREGLLKIVHELLERLEAHLVADQFYRVTCNVRTGDPDEFAAAMHAKGLGGMEGPTISQVCVFGLVFFCLAVNLWRKFVRRCVKFCTWIDRVHTLCVAIV